MQADSFATPRASEDKGCTFVRVLACPCAAPSDKHDGPAEGAEDEPLVFSKMTLVPQIGAPEKERGGSVV